jgi:hypothetical protein
MLQEEGVQRVVRLLVGDATEKNVARAAALAAAGAGPHGDIRDHVLASRGVPQREHKKRRDPSLDPDVKNLWKLLRLANFTATIPGGSYRNIDGVKLHSSVQDVFATSKETLHSCSIAFLQTQKVPPIFALIPGTEAEVVAREHALKRKFPKDSSKFKPSKEPLGAGDAAWAHVDEKTLLLVVVVKIELPHVDPHEILFNARVIRDNETKLIRGRCLEKTEVSSSLFQDQDVE